MKHQTKLADRRSGVAVVEFTLALLMLVPLLLGTLVFGFRLVRAIQMDQITRDVGRMYIRGIDFRAVGPIQNAQTMSSGFDLTASGTSVLIFSQIRVIQQTDCDAANAATPTHPAGTACLNLGKPVFGEQVTVGNTVIGVSGFGTPPVTADSVTIWDQGWNSAAQAGGGFATVLSLNPNEYAYVAEMWNKTAGLQIQGMTGQPYVYSRAIF